MMAYCNTSFFILKKQKAPDRGGNIRKVVCDYETIEGEELITLIEPLKRQCAH